MCEGNLLNLLVILLIMFVLTDISNSKHTSAQWFKASLQIMLRVNFAFQCGLRIGRRSASPDPVHRWKISTFQSITFPVNQQWFIDAPFGVSIIKTYELVCNCTFTGVSDALIPFQSDESIRWPTYLNLVERLDVIWLQVYTAHED